MDQARPLTSLSTDELIARIEQYVVVVELRDAEIRELHAANSALLAERDALIHDNSEYVSAANELATENQRLREALELAAQTCENQGRATTALDGESFYIALGQAARAIRALMPQQHCAQAHKGKE